MTVASFRKAIAPALLGFLAVVISWVASGALDIMELRIAGAAVLTSIAVYIVPNLATSPFLKALVPSFLGVVAVFVSAVESGTLDVTEARMAMAALLTSAVVWVVPNQSENRVVAP